ncbi:MAG: amidohydrolase family protein [Desulfurococcales archaeon]|nr:amidohydrolase family protein [Desulfurococcales archaeon]
MAALALVGPELEVKRGACIWIRDGVIESIESQATCPPDRLGGVTLGALPQPANAHIHSADFAFPEYAVDLPLEEAVAPPAGAKHRLLAATPTEALVRAIRALYRWAWRLGTGLLVDFREGGGEGCRLAERAASTLPPGLEVLVLGRPGPGWPEGCQGAGLSSPLDYSPEELRAIAATMKPSMAHVAETREARARGDLELALEAGFDALVHGVHLSEEDLALLAERGTPLVLCPRSNLWHSTGLPPVPQAWEAGVTTGIGTDNAGWFTPDIWAEASTLAYIARLRGGPRVAARPVLEALFVGGYRAAGLEPRLIEEGRPAHLVLVALEGRGILEALDAEWALVKRVDAGSILARIDGCGLSRLGLA